MLFSYWSRISNYEEGILHNYALIIEAQGKQIGWVSEYGHRLKFNKDFKATCPESGELYELKNDKVKLLK